MQKSGNKGTVPKGQMSEEFAKMAQQQQMIREALQKINREENKDGKGGLGNLNQMIKDMQSTETELVNKRLEQETMNRQKELLTKLLDADQAQREQDQDSKRESKAGKDLSPSYQQMLDKFKKLQQNETEWIQKLPPSLNYYYKNKIAEYFKLLNSAQ
jgi:seryl-tRNA synthetase